jgi:hypothetical protein
MSTACPATTLLERSKHFARSHIWYTDETASYLSCSRWPMHNQLCLRQAQAWGHERTGPSVLQQGNFPAHKRCSVRKSCYTLHHLFTILLSQVEEQPIHTVSEHAELEGRARTFSRDDQAPPRRHRYSKPFLRTDFIDSVSYSWACLCMN